MSTDHAGFKFVHLRDYEPVSKDVLSIIPVDLVKRQKVVPLSRTNGKLVVASIKRDENQVKPEGLQLVVRCPVELVLTSEEEIQSFIDQHYANVKSERPSKLPDPLERLLNAAALNRASELLIEKDGTRVHVRQRIRGVLISDLSAPCTPNDATAIFDFVGRTGDLKSSEGVKWASSRYEVILQNEAYACRFVLSETDNFALLTVRLVRGGEKLFNPTNWGMGPNQARVLETFLARTQGVVLFCGTDNDEITRNLHACARELATPERHLIFVESGFEEWFPGIEQLVSDGNPARFGTNLELAFRHAPDVVVANPLEKKEHFETAFAESLKGRLVLARCFARDAADAMVNLLSMGIEPYFIGAALLGVVAQRQIRLNCALCQEKEVVPRERIKDIIPAAMQPAAFFRGRGCEGCMKTGYDRETNIYEVLEVTEDVRHALAPGIKTEALRAFVKTNGMMTLRQMAVHKAINGQTSLAEVLRVSP